MTAASISALFRADIRSVLEAYILLEAGHAGTAGITTTQLADITGQSDSVVRIASRRLIGKGLLNRPTSDTCKGKPNRYTITPAGLALLLAPVGTIPPPVMAPLPLAV